MMLKMMVNIVMMMIDKLQLLPGKQLHYHHSYDAQDDGEHSDDDDDAHQ